MLPDRSLSVVYREPGSCAHANSCESGRAVVSVSGSEFLTKNRFGTVHLYRLYERQDTVPQSGFRSPPLDLYNALPPIYQESTTAAADNRYHAVKSGKPKVDPHTRGGYGASHVARPIVDQAALRAGFGELNL